MFQRDEFNFSVDACIVKMGLMIISKTTFKAIIRKPVHL